MPLPLTLQEALKQPSRPVFLFGSTPPRDDTTLEKAKETCAKFAARSAVLATDGFIVYDIQDEAKRTTLERPFPFRKTMDPSLYASFFPVYSGKECIVYKAVQDSTTDDYDRWLHNATEVYGHNCFTLVGPASSKEPRTGISLSSAAERTREQTRAAFGCVCIPERHTSKGNENISMFNKINFGAEWFITQGIFSAAPIIRLITDYGTLCKERNIVPKKIILTFAPCGRAKTMKFIKWLGMDVPEEIEKRILEATDQVCVFQSLSPLVTYYSFVTHSCNNPLMYIMNRSTENNI
jgi:5,10-methylenetetrahydrofolate reductase